MNQIRLTPEELTEIILETDDVGVVSILSFLVVIRQFGDVGLELSANKHLQDYLRSKLPEYDEHIKRMKARNN